MVLPSNLLVSLHRWAHRQDENFVTDAFAHLLRHLLQSSPELSCEMIGMLSEDRLTLSPDQCGQVTVETQKPDEVGTPDIVIQWNDLLLFIEVKVDSGFEKTQLRRYRTMLDRRIASGSATQTCLTTLTRRCPPTGDIQHFDCVAVRWQSVVVKLERLALNQPPETESAILIRQFTDFLRHRMIEMQQISPGMTEGVASFRCMLEMIEQSISDHEIAVHQKMSGWKKIGFWLQKKRWRITIWYSQPDEVLFEVFGLNISEADMQEIGIGAFRKEDSSDRLKWANTLKLRDTDVDFYSASPEQQKDQLDAFIKISKATASELERLSQ